MKKKNIVAVGCSIVIIFVSLLGCAPTAAEEKVKTTEFKYVDEYIQQTEDSLEGVKSTDTAIKVEEPTIDMASYEKQLVSEVVYAEAGGEGYFGMVLIAQCIKNASELDGISPTEAIEKYGYAKPKANPSKTATDAVQAVFEEGLELTEEPIKYFYAPARVESEWHESQEFVLEHGSHRFFKER